MMTSTPKMPRISVLVPTYKATEHLLCCVRSLMRSVDKDEFEVCIYGDGGGDASRLAIEKIECLCKEADLVCRAFYNSINLGNTAAVNGARRLARGEWLLLVNDDMVFPNNWYALATADLKVGTVLSLSCIEPNVGGHVPAACFVGMNLGLDPNIFNFEGFDSQNEALFDPVLEVGVNYPFLVEAQVFDAVGGVDERFFGPYHDPDLFLRFRLKGLKMLRTRKCWVYHFSGISQRFIDESNGTKNRRKKSAFWRRHENTARLQFIKKWGAKPKAKFGEIPQTKAVQPWENRSHQAAESLGYFLLIAWEHMRIFWQKMIGL